jgi:hypothetical protein
VIQGHVETTRTLIFDVSDVEDPVLAREFFGSFPASAHNLYVRGDLTYQANYRYGLHVLNTSDPENPEEVGYFNTTPFLSGPGFSGAWSTYPYFEEDGLVLALVPQAENALADQLLTRPAVEPDGGGIGVGDYTVIAQDEQRLGQVLEEMAVALRHHAILARMVGPEMP